MNSSIKYLPAVEDDPQRRRPDISRAKKYLNWEPKVFLGIIISNTGFFNLRFIRRFPWTQDYERLSNTSGVKFCDRQCLLFRRSFWNVRTKTCGKAQAQAAVRNYYYFFFYLKIELVVFVCITEIYVNLIRIYVWYVVRYETFKLHQLIFSVLNLNFC